MKQAVDNWCDQGVLVTGGTGMIGVNLVRRLVKMGVRTCLLVRNPDRLERLGDIAERVEVMQGDVVDAASVADAVERSKPAIVFHLASSFFNPPTLTAGEHMAINALGTLNVCEALRGASKSRLIFAGSCAVYAGGNSLTEDLPLSPDSIFGISKASATMIVQSAARLNGLQAVELRLFGPFGPWENARRIIPDTILTALSGRDVEIGHGGQERDFIYMDDVIDAFLLAAGGAAPAGAVFNIASGTGRPIKEVVSRILHTMGDPVGFHCGVRPSRPDEIWTISGDVSSAESVLGWHPRIDFDEGLRRTIQWFAEHRDIAHLLV